MRTVFGRYVSVLIFLTPYVFSQSAAPVTVSWPDSSKPMLKLVFAGFVQAGMTNGAGVYTSEVSAQNVSDQAMPRSVFTINILDAKGVKIGRAHNEMTDGWSGHTSDPLSPVS